MSVKNTAKKNKVKVNESGLTIDEEKAVKEIYDKLHQDLEPFVSDYIDALVSDMDGKKKVLKDIKILFESIEIKIGVKSTSYREKLEKLDDIPNYYI